MNATDTRPYRFIPGVSEVVDLDLDSLGLHNADGTPIAEASLEVAAIAAEYRAHLPATDGLVEDEVYDEDGLYR